MLENGNPEAKAFLSQLDNAEATPFRCKCGCASINFKIKDRPHAPPGVHLLAEFEFGDGDNLSGIMIYESRGILSALEVFGLAGDAAKGVPSPEALRPYGTLSSS
jgi:hypothetical protein